MACTTASRTAILYQNSNKTVTLIDIPTSIALAQSTPEHPDMDILLSSAPIQTPYPSLEPKTAAARAKVLERMDAEGRIMHQALQPLIAAALVEIRKNHGADWCLPRSISHVEPVRKSKKRKLDRGEGAGSVAVATREPEILVADMSSSSAEALEPSKLSPVSTIEASAIANRLVYNPCSTTTKLYIPPTAQPYKIPAHSSFYLTKVDPQSTEALAKAAYDLYPMSTPTAGPGQFDFILLDPPWANRSVRRSSSYKTSEDLESDPLHALQGMLDRHIPSQGLVGCWITNKAASRSQALEAFRAWNVTLIEQWVWVKTTTIGEPVTALEGIWRKPYEVLLVGRKSNWNDQSEESEEAQHQNNVVKRILVGVPDMHSRKPCLKELIAPMMKDRAWYRGLEIFARNLTAGWCAWGDEVPKFNWDGHWWKAGEVVDAASTHMPGPGMTPKKAFLQD